MHRPLENVKVVVTRAKEQADGFAALLSGQGASVILFPTIEFKEPGDLSVVDGAIRELISDKSAYDWIIFTSANGVRFFVRRLKALSQGLDLIFGIKTGAVGPKTAELLGELGVHVDLVPDDFRAEGLIRGLQEEGISGKRILIPRALLGRDILPDVLSEDGASVTLAPVYETVCPEGNDKAGLIETLSGGGETVLTFTSGSTVKNFFSLFTRDEIESFIDRVKIAVISPVTEMVVYKLGYKVDIMPDIYTANALADKIVNSIV